jgi:hypothetical protein
MRGQSETERLNKSLEVDDDDDDDDDDEYNMQCLITR